MIYAGMDDKTIKRVLEKFGVDYRQIRDVQKGYRNESYPVVRSSGETINLMFYKQEPHILQKIKHSHAVARYLAERGMAVRVPLNNRLLLLRAGTLQKYAALYNYLPGETIPWEAYTQEHIKLLGQTMAEMHGSLASFDAAELKMQADAAGQSLGLLARMAFYLQDTGVQRALKAKLNLTLPHGSLDRLEKLLKALKKLPNKQALHMDFVRGNILFRPKTADQPLAISGILDFEKTAYGHPLFDVARTLAFLLVDCKYKPEEKVRKYFLLSGYKKRGGASLPSITVSLDGIKTEALEALINFFLLHDFYKFLRHNPYEPLEQNEHYLRTRNFLLRRGVLK